MNKRQLRRIIREETKKQLDEYSSSDANIRLDGITFAVRGTVNRRGTIEIYLIPDETDIRMDAFDLSLLIDQKTGIELQPLGNTRGKDTYSFRLPAEELPKMIKRLTR